MTSYYINRATLCSLVIALYLCLLSYSSIAVASAAPYPGQHFMNDQLVEREPLVACSAVKGLHIECNPGGLKPNLNVLNTAKTPQGSTKKAARHVQRRANALMLERALRSHLGGEGTYDRLARREAVESLY